MGKHADYLIEIEEKNSESHVPKIISKVREREILAKHVESSCEMPTTARM